MSGETTWVLDIINLVQMIKNPSSKTFGEMAEFMFDQMMALYESRIVKIIGVFLQLICPSVN